jgi:hypothetical protein
MKKGYYNERSISNTLKFEPKAKFQEDSNGKKNFKCVKNLSG